MNVLMFLMYIRQLQSRSVYTTSYKIGAFKLLKKIV